MSFIEFARRYGIDIEYVSKYGVKVRASLIGRNTGKLDGVYCLYDDTYGQIGWVKNFRTGEYAVYRDIEGVEHITLKSKLHEVKNQCKQFEYDVAAKQAQSLIKSKFKKATDVHPYLRSKNISAHGTYIDQYGLLIVPLKNISGEIRSLQRIYPDGRKYYMKDSCRIGCFYQFGKKLQDVVIICEGFATGASIYEATKITTVSAGDASNIENVALAIREKHKYELRIIIAGDDDTKLKNNVGRISATKAAEKVNGMAIFPDFTNEEQSQGYTDFNDYANTRGRSSLKQFIDECVAYQNNTKIVKKRRIL